MNKITRNISKLIGIPLAVFCGVLAISVFIGGILEQEENAWGIFLLLSLACITCIFCILLACSLKFENALYKSVFGVALSQLENALRKSVSAGTLRSCQSVFADAIRLGGKQMLCDIIKWTIIIIIAAIIFSATYKITVS